MECIEMNYYIDLMQMCFALHPIGLCSMFTKTQFEISTFVYLNFTDFKRIYFEENESDKNKNEQSKSKI